MINGSASNNSANERLIAFIAKTLTEDFNCSIFSYLKTLPHFDPKLSAENPPQSIIDFREAVNQAVGVIICTPEYVFSIPSGLKNAIEWCVATTVFSDKPLGIVTASAHGLKGHEELQLIMKTVMARLNNETNLLIQGIKGKIDEQGEIQDVKTKAALSDFTVAFKNLING